MNNENMKQIFSFLQAVNGLKFIQRYGKNAQGDRKDSSAAHSWRLILMTMIFAERTNVSLDILKTIKIAIVHDIPEVIANDTPFSEIFTEKTTVEQKQDKEIIGMKKLCSLLPEDIGKEIYDLWKEYDDNQTNEAKFVKVLDKIEAAFHVIDMGVKNHLYPGAIIEHPKQMYGRVPELDEMITYTLNELKKEFETSNIPWEENAKKI